MLKSDLHTCAHTPSYNCAHTQIDMHTYIHTQSRVRPESTEAYAQGNEYKETSLADDANPNPNPKPNFIYQALVPKQTNFIRLNEHGNNMQDFLSLYTV